MKTDPFDTDHGYSGIHFFNNSGIPVPVNQQNAEQIAEAIETEESCSFKLIEIAFVDEDEIIEINREHLDHDYITDIITFRYDDENSLQNVEGTLYCCAQRISEQAKSYNQPSKAEFNRIIIHGLLHLVGYDDKNDDDRKKMRQRESFYLAQLS